MIYLIYMYCKRGNFRVGIPFTFFALLSFSGKIHPRENKTHIYAFMKEKEEES